MVKGHRSKSVTFGVVVTNKLDNSIISESSSVDLIDGAKVSSTKRTKQPITKLPYKNTKVFRTQLNTFRVNILMCLTHGGSESLPSRAKTKNHPILMKNS